MKVVLEPDDAPIEVDGRADDHGLEFEQLPEKVWVDAGHFGVFLDEGVYDARRGNYLPVNELCEISLLRRAAKPASKRITAPQKREATKALGSASTDTKEGAKTRASKGLVPPFSRTQRTSAKSPDRYRGSASGSGNR